MRIWDINPFSPTPDRCIQTLFDNPQGFEKHLLDATWSADGKHVAAGCGDRSLMIWDWQAPEIKYKLPGHKGTVMGCDWHPKEDICTCFYLFSIIYHVLTENLIVASGSTDKTIYLSEIAL